MERFDQLNSERAAPEYRVYADFLPYFEAVKKEPPEGGTPNGNHLIRRFPHA